MGGPARLRREAASARSRRSAFGAEADGAKPPGLLMRPRDLLRLTSSSYDVLVVGGGIYGLTCAYEAASRGLRVALIDAADYGSGTSFNQQKTAHGGLRSLQSFSFGRARQAIRERQTLARIAPWLLRPLPFIVGTYRSVTKSRVALGAAFAIDARLGKHRNAGIEPELHLPPARLLSRTATLKLFPGVRQQNLTGGAQWYDYQMVENDRLTFAFAAAADRAGADLANYVEARSFLRQNGRIAGVRAQDVLTGAELEVQARIVVNAAGARAGHVMTLASVSRPFPLIRAMNLVTTKPAADIALAARDSERRMLTLVPWRGKAIVGTGQSTTISTETTPDVPTSEVEQFITAANRAFPALKLTLDDVTLVHRGHVPAVTHGGRAELLPTSQILDHATEGADGLVTLVGAKYTTARATADRAVTLIGRKLRKAVSASRTSTTILPGAGIADHEALAIETGRHLHLDVPLPVIRHLIGRYGEAAAEIVKLVAARPQLAAGVAPAVSTISAEVVHAIAHESAMRLSDIVLRRTTLGAAGHPGSVALETCATVAAAELGWDATRVRDEIEAVERVYGIERHPRQELKQE
jgi:glycerol-3-phosphate dehydrogenase